MILNFLSRKKYSSCKTFRTFIFFTGALLMTFLTVRGQSKFPEDVQYKKLPTDAIALIANGSVDSAIEQLEKYLIDFPEHTEFHYCMAVAQSVKENIPKSIEHIKIAMRLGMPIERFIAGPRDLLKNTTESKAFKKLIKNKSTKIVHGPMLGDVTHTSAKIWIRTAKEEEVTIVLSKVGDRKNHSFSNKT